MRSKERCSVAAMIGTRQLRRANPELAAIG